MESFILCGLFAIRSSVSSGSLVKGQCPNVLIRLRDQAVGWSGESHW